MSVARRRLSRKGGPVNILEVIQTRNAQLTKPGDANYSPYFDVDGSAGINWT